jgi:sortase A
MHERWRRRLGGILVALGLLSIAWASVVWAWRDPFTSLYTYAEQQRLGDRYESLVAESGLARMDDREAAARRLRALSRPGDPIGRIRIERLGLDLILVEGTDTKSLRKGPGRDRRSSMPGEGKLVYVAGHRTTYGAPFGEIDRLRSGDRVELDLPYGTFSYEVTGHRIVASNDLSVLREPGGEVLRLQACHPRFFASQRYVVSARLVNVDPADGGRERLAGALTR